MFENELVGEGVVREKDEVSAADEQTRREGSGEILIGLIWKVAGGKWDDVWVHY